MKTSRHAQTDDFGLVLSTASADAAAAYRRGIDALLTAQPDAGRQFEESLERDPGFALASAAKALTTRSVDEAEHLLTVATRHASTATPREAMHVAVVSNTARGAWQPAIDLARDHLREYPADALIVSQALSLLHRYGGPTRKQAALALIDGVSAAYAGDWFISSRSAFQLGEVGRLLEARKLAERALDMRPECAVSAHAFAHVLHGSGKPVESVHFLQSFLSRHSRPGGMHGHLHWHVALGLLDLGRSDEAASVYRNGCQSAQDGDFALQLADAAGFLYRLELAQVRDLPTDGIRELLRRARADLDEPFLAVHACAALAAVGSLGELIELVDQVEYLASDNEALVRSALPIARAMLSLRTGDYLEAAINLGCLNGDALEGIGGSNVQRSMILELHDRILSNIEGVHSIPYEPASPSAAAG